MKTTKSKLPAFQFYVKDWLTDPELSSCSPTARALWIDFLCVAWQMDRPGTMATNGRPWTTDRIAKTLRGDNARNKKAIKELLEKGVMLQDEQGAYFSARMVRDGDIIAKRRIAGSKGGLTRASKSQAKSKQKSSKASDVACDLLAKSGKQNLPPPSSSANNKPKASAFALSPDRRSGKPNPIWDWIVDRFYPSGISPSDRTKIGKVVRDLRAKGATPDEMERRSKIYRKVWPAMTLTAHALEKHWDTVIEEERNGNGTADRRGSQDVTRIRKKRKT